MAKAKVKGKAYVEYRDGSWVAEMRDGADTDEVGKFKTKPEAVEAIFEHMGDRERGVNIIQPKAQAGPEGDAPKNGRSTQGEETAKPSTK